MYFLSNLMEVHLGLPRRLSVKNSLANARDTEYEGLVPGSGRSIGERNRNLSQYSCLENSMERGTWPATVHGVAKSWTQLSDFHFHFSGKWDIQELSRNC